METGHPASRGRPVAHDHVGGDLDLPPGYRERLPRSWGPWADELPEIVASSLARWELRITDRLPLSHSFVVAVERSDGRACVLKVQPTDVPDGERAQSELRGLRLAGPVAVEVIEEDVENGVLLLERAVPGTTLEETALRDDDAATEALGTVIRDYARPLDDPSSLGLRPFDELAAAFDRFDRGPHGDVARKKLPSTAAARLPVVLGVDQRGTAVSALRSARVTAERVMTELLADHEPPHLLHGDLHHGNVLFDEQRGLLVIDPWGLYGDRAADVAPALHNPIELVAETPDAGALIRRRLAIFAEVLDIDEDRLTAWCYVYNVIRALWSLEDHDDLSEDDAGVRTVVALRRRI